MPAAAVLIGWSAQAVGDASGKPGASAARHEPPHGIQQAQHVNRMKVKLADTCRVLRRAREPRSQARGRAGANVAVPGLAKARCHVEQRIDTDRKYHGRQSKPADHHIVVKIVVGHASGSRPDDDKLEC